MRDIQQNEDEELEPEVIYIPDEDGNEEEFEVVLRFHVEGEEFQYIFVTPMEGDADDDMIDYQDVYVFRYEEEGDDIKLYPVESEEEWNYVEMVFDRVMTNPKKEYDDSDEEDEDEEDEERDTSRLR